MMDRAYIDARALKELLVTTPCISTNKGDLIRVETVLDVIDVAMANYACNPSGSNQINIDKWKRILDRNRKELQRLRDNEENLSKFGQHDLCYFKGKVSVLEDLFDELGIAVE
jgi:hypothetical protein